MWIGRQDTSYPQDSIWPSTQRPLPFKPTPMLDGSPNAPRETVPGTRRYLGPHSLIHTGVCSEPGSRPYTQRGSSQEVEGGRRIQLWGCLLSGDICFSSSGSAVPSKGTSTNLDPEQGPQAMLCEPVSSLCCPDVHQPVLHLEHPPSTPGHSLPWFALHPCPGHPSIPHTPSGSPQVAEEDAGLLPHQDPPIRN